MYKEKLKQASEERARRRKASAARPALAGYLSLGLGTLPEMQEGARALRFDIET